MPRKPNHNRTPKQAFAVVRRLTKHILALSVSLAALSGPAHALEESVFIVHLDEPITGSDVAFVERVLTKAEPRHASAVIVEIDATSCPLKLAEKISGLLLAEETHTVAFVNTEAAGNSALIALSCIHLAISPDGAIGGLGTEQRSRADIAKARAAFGVVAKERGRSRDLMEAMVLARFDIDGLAKKGESLRLSAEQAIEHKAADLAAEDYEDIAERYHLAGEATTHFEASAWDTLLSVLLNPWISLILLVIGIRLLVLDLLTINTWGAAGTFGALAIACVFVPHALVGASWIGFCVFFVAVWLMLLESYVLPGIGLAFVFGTITSFVGIYLGMGGSQTSDWLGIVAAIVGTYFMVAGFFIHLPKSHGWQLISIRDRTELLGKSVPRALEGKHGLTISRLNPYGSAVVDGVRVSCMTDEEIIPEGTPVCVTRVEGDTVYVERAARGPCA